MNVKRKEYKLFGNVLLEPEKAARTGVVIAKDARDPGNPEDPTVLRPGLIVAKAADGKVYEYGRNFVQVTNETKTGDGSTKEFTLNNNHLVPYSETVKIGNSVQDRDIDYKIDYKRGVITFFTAPASGASIKISYLHDPKRDGTEIPFGILEDYVYLKDESGTPEDVNELVVISAHVKEGELKVAKGGLEWAKAYLAKHGFLGVTDPEYAL